MNSLQILHLSLSIGFLTLVGFLCYALYYLADDLKILKVILGNIENVTTDVDQLRNQIKLGITSLLNMFLNKRKAVVKDGK